MMHNINVPLFAVYLLTVPIWLGTAIVAYRYKRALVCAGFTSAGLNSIVAAILKAGGSVPSLLSFMSAGASIAVVGLICAGLIGNLPARRPDKWTT